MTDFFDDLERELRRAHRRDIERHASSRVFDLRRLPGIRVAGRRTLVALAVVVALVAVVLAVARESDVERQAAPQPAPGKEVVVTDVDDGIRWRLDGRVLTVQLLPYVPDRTVRMVSGARISATCRANVAAEPGDPRAETTLTRRWPDGQTSMSYRFPRDVSSWCVLRDQSGSIVAFVGFPGGSLGAAGPYLGATGPIAETAFKWARHFGSGNYSCTDFMSQTVCEQGFNQGYGESFRGATIQEIAIKGDEAAARFSNGETIRLHRQPNGDWLVAKFGENAGRGIFE